MRSTPPNALDLFHPAVRTWFAASFGEPTRPQALGWPAIARGDSTLILAPTGSGKTLAAFLWCLDRLMFAEVPPRAERCRVLYISPLKALAVDIERNLRAPLVGIAAAAAARGEAYVAPAIAVRSGDTPAADRARFQREPADILITTPESLYLLLTSNARTVLRSVRTVIVDEIHALVASKRGAHLAVSLERLTALCARPPQRIGLSATQRPLDEVARFLGGAEPSVRGPGPTADASRSLRRWDAGSAGAPVELAHELGGGAPPRYRPVTIVDAGTSKPLALTVQLPVEEMARLGADDGPAPAAAPDRGPEAGAGESQPPSIWTAIHSRLLDLIRAHHTTLVFVNSRRLAERLAGALNDLAGEGLVRSHHGSLARAQRAEVEEQLKAGALRGLVATSSLELGIDMGAVDLVVQIEAPPSVASGLQRIGRAGHRAGAVSAGVIFPKFRGDLIACAAAARAMHEGAVEATRYPRNPLDVLAQQIVAMTAVEEWDVERLFATIRSAAPFADLSRAAFEGVLDMLSGRYPSDQFADLRPRVTWHRGAGTIRAREGARRIAVTSGGTIPDRGLYGVFLAGAGRERARVGELDEEMVFESRVGDVFVLGASSWRIEAITHDRVLVSPAPGEPGRMPFWKGDRAGRPLELGLAIGRLTRELLRLAPQTAVEHLMTRHDLDRPAAETLLQYLREQLAHTRAVPDEATIVVERVRDELGDWRVCVLSPRGGRVHAPWAIAAAARIRDAAGLDVDTLWGDDGFVVRFPDADRPPDAALFLPDPDEVQDLVVRQLGATALFAAKFRENAARSLLLPRRRPGMRAPLWQQRKRAADLLGIAARYGSFPVLLETYRECLRDVFDMPALVETLAAIRSRSVRVVVVDSERPSPFAASLLFSYVANFLYEGDAPLAERRAQALAVDQAQLRDLLGDAELRDLLDAEAARELEAELQRLAAGTRARHPDAVHDLLLAVGDLSEGELAARVEGDAAALIGALVDAGRAVQVEMAGEARYVAVEDAARYRDAVGCRLPAGIPAALLAPAEDPLGNLALRYARTHAPFTASELAARYGLAPGAAEAVLRRLAGDGRLLEGEFRPGGRTREWTDPNVLRQLRRRSLARLRHEAAPVDPPTLGRLITTWQGLVRRRLGAQGLLEAIEQLQGAPLVASLLETEILPARVDRYDPADLDALAAAGDVVWVGLERLGDRDGRIALFLGDQLRRLLPPSAADGRPQPRGPARAAAHGPRAQATARADRPARILEYLRAHGASFFGAIHEAAGGGYPAETVDALWELAWRGLVTNDTFHALRAYTRAPAARPRRPAPAALAPRRLAPPSAEGRWSVVAGRAEAREPRSPGWTRWAVAVTEQLLARYGVLTREALSAETVPGGFSTVYPVLTAMEERGRIRRGYFVAGLGAAQFALPGAVDLLRAARRPPAEPEVVVLSAVDPGNPYGAMLPWPRSRACGEHRTGLHELQPACTETRRAATPAVEGAEASGRPSRTVGATVILVDGALAAYLARGDRQLLAFLPDLEPERSRTARAVAHALIDRARHPVGPESAPRGMLIETIDGAPAAAHPLGPYLIEVGFLAGAMGFQPDPRLAAAPFRA